MRVVSFVLFPLVGLVISSSWAAEPIRTPYARQEPLEIRRVVLPETAIRQCELVELTVDLRATYDNPFDSADIALDAQITHAGGKSQTVPGFFVVPFRAEANTEREELHADGEAAWRIRWTPTQPGDYTVVVSVRDRTGQRRSEPLELSAAASEDPGFVRISPRDRRYFEFDNGRAFYPIGLNLCWPSTERKTRDYDAWIPAFARAGCTAIRLWLAPSWNPLALERSGRPAKGAGLGQFDQQAAWRLDHVLELAQREGLYVKLCLDSYNELREKDAYPHWEETPQNAIHGGPLARPAEFWTNATMDRFYREKLRYLVARYGAFTHVLAWEFWNEADITTDYQTEPARAWHQRMAGYLRSIDPYEHLITTSFSRSEGDPAIDALPELDYVQTHRYGGTDPVRSLAGYQAEKEKYGKPHYVGEFGADGGGDRFSDDPQGVQIHDPLWLTVASGGSGAAQAWWWELIHDRRMHDFYRHLARFTADIDWPGEQMRRIQPRLEWPAPPAVLPRKDWMAETADPWHCAAEILRPRTIRVDGNGVHGELPVAGIQHSATGHPKEHNPLRLETDLPWPTRFEVSVSTVSGWGGAKLELRLDGQIALAREFADTNVSGEHQDLRQYAGVYGVDIPAGKHVVELANRGADWFHCGYRLREGLECHTPPLLAWATAGQTTTLAWVRLEERTWQRLCEEREPVAPCPTSLLILPELVPGSWKAEIWDTWTGQVLEEQTLRVDAAGEGRVTLPPVTTDLAVRLRRAP